MRAKYLGKTKKILAYSYEPKECGKNSRLYTLEHGKIYNVDVRFGLTSYIRNDIITEHNETICYVDSEFARKNFELIEFTI